MTESSPREPKQVRGRETRDALLQAAMELVAEEGLLALSHREVAKRAGVTRGMVGYFFGSIEELKLAAVTRHYGGRADEYRVLTESIRSTDLEPMEILRLAAAAVTSSSPDLVIAHYDITVNAARNAEVREILATFLADFDELMLAAMEAVGFPDPPGTLRTVAAVIDGFQLRRIAMKEADAGEQLAHAFGLIYLGALASAGADDGVEAERES